MTEQRLPGPTPSGGKYGVLRHLDAEGNPTEAANAVSLVFDEYDEDDTLISSTSADLGDEDARTSAA